MEESETFSSSRALAKGVLWVLTFSDTRVLHEVLCKVVLQIGHPADPCYGRGRAVGANMLWLVGLPPLTPETNYRMLFFAIPLYVWCIWYKFAVLCVDRKDERTFINQRMSILLL